MSPAAEKVVRRLDAIRQQWWLFTLLTTSILATGASFLTLFVFVLADSFLRFSQYVLGGMLIVWLGVTVWLIVLVCRRLIRSQRSLEATARCVEAEFPELGSSLINVVQLSGDTKNEDRAFCDAAVADAASRIGAVRLEEAAAKETRWRRFRYCMQTPRDLAETAAALALLIVMAVVVNSVHPVLGSAVNRLLAPYRYVPMTGSVEILKVEPGNTEVLAGAGVEFMVEIVDDTTDEDPDDRSDNQADGQAPKAQPPPATLFYKLEGAASEESLSMEPGRRFLVETSRSGKKIEQPRRRYTLSFPSLAGPMEYRVEVGDSQSDKYRIQISRKPVIDQVEVTYRYPGYLSRTAETLTQETADLEAPQYTIAELRIRPSTPIASGYIDAEGQRFTGRIEESGTRMDIVMPLLRNTTFTVHMLNHRGDQEPNPRLNRVHVLEDRPPSVELLKPGRQTSVAPGADVAVRIRAADDHGLGGVRLEMKVQATVSPSAAAGESSALDGGERSEFDLEADELFGAASDTPRPATSNATPAAPVSTVKQWTDFQSGKAVLLDHRLELPEERFQAGQTLMIRAVARDRRDFAEWGLDLKPREVAGPWSVIRIIDEQAKVDATLEQLDDLRAAILSILENQIRAQVRTALIPGQGPIDESLASAGEVRAIQLDVQKSSISLVKSIGATDRQERQAVKRILNQLAFGDMLQAVSVCDDLVKITATAGLAQPAEELYETQGRIIDVLRRLLDITRRAQTEELAEMKHRDVGDLPDDARKKLDDLNAALDEAMEAQRKVVEASENLAKAPVEDFSEAEEQLVMALEAAEDAWAKFMTELNTDLSKLPDQDFANPSALSELVEIQTEIKMAEDALLKKTADIAVPLEQLGAEMAEEIKTNMEKWLPDTPDRERWSQEESLTDEGKEAPMAELPGELEDLIGELLEEEEDLFDEMEDVSSSAADSLDKGAGWDVADGPISNMSAKGATGNRLPNTSEIGGRAGEGRQGKSSGEFVGDEAVGKGGRKTPSRLTPDPYVAGQIKDHSTDPTGGATGGGKESGQGGEGLEGPQRNQHAQREMNRLAGKQADLRNKAEGVDLQHFQVMGYHHTDLTEMIDLMADVERDLRAGRYHNAVRQRRVMAEGLGAVKQRLQGEFEVRRDATVNLPTDVQEELLGGMQDPSPVGWDEMNREYFQRLSKGPADTAAALPVRQE